MKALAIKADEYIFHLGKSDPKNISVYVKEVPRSEFTKKILPVISEIYRESKRHQRPRDKKETLGEQPREGMKDEHKLIVMPD